MLNPNALMNNSGELSFSVSDSDLFTLTGITASPFNWFEATYYYVNIKDVYWGSKLGYLDKGFNAKFRLIDGSKYKYLPSLAIGLNDLAGTGLFSSEYIVATKDFDFMKFTLGLGYGALANNKTIKNPLSIIGERFTRRQSSSIENIYDVGSFSYQEWFTGEASIFGGMEIYVPKIKGLKLILETNNYDFSLSGCAGGCLNADLRKTKSNFNYAVNYRVNDNLTISFNNVNKEQHTLSFRLGLNISGNDNYVKTDSPEVAVLKNKDKLSFYRSVKDNLNNNNLFLQEAEYRNKHISITIAQSKYINQVRAAEEAANIILKTDPSMSNDIESFSITSINSGLGINKLIFSKNDLKNKNRIPNETILIEKVASKDLYNNEYLPKLVFPIIANSFTPQGLHHIGSPERFYYGGLALKIDTSVLFSRKLSLESNFNLNIYNEFDRKINKPDSALPHVRSEVVRYLQESENYFSKLQLNYNDEFIDDFYYRLSGGIYENMFAGIGGELLYSPFEKDFAFGVNIYKVRQRDYDQLFNFLDYETTTGHFNFYYTEPRSKITAHISYGRYLAKDDGYTIDFSRGFRNGSTIGAFFTITDVPRELFGEGSFDKGFYFKIPINLFTKDDRVGGFSWAMRPLTRDGGQKLEDTGNLYGLIYGSKYNEIKSFINYLNEE